MKKKRIILKVLLVLLLVFSLVQVWENVTVGTTYYEISSSELPISFDGYRIAQISDFHNATFGKDNSMLLDILVNESPDIIVLTGDFIDSRRTNVEISVKFAKELVKIADCYYIPGNHESRIDEDFKKLTNELESIGVIVLRNSKVELNNKSDMITIIGIDDPAFSGESYRVYPAVLDKWIKEVGLNEGYNILLTHRPEFFDTYVENDFDLVFTGHAHGGQFRIFGRGIIGPNLSFFPELTSGVALKDNTSMVISRGIGNSLCPIRINNRPEVIIATLKIF